MTQYDIFGLGSALMDILVEVPDQTLDHLNLKKAEMTLIDRNQCDIIENEIKQIKSKRVPGGATANACVVASQLGANVAFCGVVGSDMSGGMYKEKMDQAKVHPFLTSTDSNTGHALTFITPDSERSFAVHLGAALDLDRAHIPLEALKESKILHTETYLLAQPGTLKDACLHAMGVAKKNGVKISLDLSDANIIRNNKEEIISIIKTYVDIVFANEDEAEALTEEAPFDAVEKIKDLCNIAVVKMGKDGSVIKTKEETITIHPHPANEVDTTGAGDSYAACVLYAISQGLPIKTGGNLGSYVASQVVSQIGARLDKINTEKVKEILEK